MRFSDVPAIRKIFWPTLMSENRVKLDLNGVRKAAVFFAQRDSLPFTFLSCF